MYPISNHYFLAHYRDNLPGKRVALLCFINPMRDGRRRSHWCSHPRTWKEVEKQDAEAWNEAIAQIGEVDGMEVGSQSSQD